MRGGHALDGAGELAPVEPAETAELRESAPPVRAWHGTHPVVRRAAEAVAWLAGAAAVFSVFLLITRTDAVSSDAANNALQSWDLLHGNLTLHGWILGDVTFYTFELPLIAVTEAIFGLGPFAVQVALALVYLAVAACAVAIAVTDSRGLSRAARAGVVIAVLCAPILVASDRWVPLGLPDHTGTTVFMLVSVLLVDRARARWFTPPLLCLILCAGQLSDGTVRYVALPAIVLVCLYHVAFSPGRRLRTGDAACLAAAAVSYPLSLAVRAVLKHDGGYLMVSPKTERAPSSVWPNNLALTWHALRTLFGQVAGAHAPAASSVTAAFGACCMLAAAAGIARVLWRWRSASRAEQLLVVMIVVNIGAYAVSTLPRLETQHDIVLVLPAGAVLAARALVPARIAGRMLAAVVCAAAATAALLPLTVQATQFAARKDDAKAPALTAWLRAHGLRYGLAGYWYGSAITLESGGQVQVRAVEATGRGITQYAWEMDAAWYNPAKFYANFILIDPADAALGRVAARIFGRPVSTTEVGGVEVLIYRQNLLKRVGPPSLPQLS
jgi:hypothetical protein